MLLKTKGYAEDMDYSDFNERFQSEDDCFKYLVSLRWRDGYSCPQCGCKEMWQVGSYKYKCRKCGYQTSVTAGTAFNHTHVSMLQWFQAIWYMSVQGRKATAKELESDIGVGSNRTALTMINRIRSEMFTIDNDLISRPLNGNIDICIDKGKNILTAVEIVSHEKGHIRLYEMENYDAECFRQFVLNNLQSGSNIKRERGHWKLGRDIDGYTFNVRTPELYEAHYANEIYESFKKYSEQKRENKEKQTAEIIDEFVFLVNSFTYEISFVEIIYNFLNFKPRENPLKLKK